MMEERNSIQLAWEEKYIKKVQFWNEVDDLIAKDKKRPKEKKSGRTSKTASSSDISLESQDAMRGQVGFVPPANSNVTSTGDRVLKRGSHGTFEVSSEDFILPSEIVLARISGDRVTLPKTNRKTYHRARVIHTQQSKAAGFMSISEDLYYFRKDIADENIFAPDFIPILLTLHEKIKSEFPNEKVQVNSGYRWWVEDKDTPYDAHMCGCAIDIGCSGKTRYVVADAAWEMGLRGIAVANSFVHIDCTPDGGGWTYGNVPKYRGPESH